VSKPPADEHAGLYARQFEALQIWGRSRETVSAGERARIDAIVAAIPPDTNTILEVGCADGLVTNELSRAGYQVTGVDLVPELLAFVEAPTVEASVDDLPFPDSSFDCVVAPDVLEHLPARMFEASLLEIARVALRSIVIDCPHREDLVQLQARCERCQTTFHASHHVRSVAEPDVESWFAGFRVTSTTLTGESWPFRSRRLQRLAQAAGGTFYRGPDIVCPMCGYDVVPARPNPFVYAANGALQHAAAAIRGSRPSELVVVLERDATDGDPGTHAPTARG
jgi:SAM-dependent methyltransferase